MEDPAVGVVSVGLADGGVPATPASEHGVVKLGAWRSKHSARAKRWRCGGELSSFAEDGEGFGVRLTPKPEGRALANESTAGLGVDPARPHAALASLCNAASSAEIGIPGMRGGVQKVLDSPVASSVDGGGLASKPDISWLCSVGEFGYC